VRGFDFSAGQPRTLFRDVELILESLERAKTIMRALGRYVPVELVRELFNANQEPVLGGRQQELSIMFTDIKGFTSLAEKVTPDELARKLGAYLEAMTNAVHAHSGVIDKFIGDAVMAMWNAPTPTPGHAEKACRAALACAEATARLYASPQWQGLPPLVTRFGIHKDTVMVGHFGAPDRMSFTALGDGVNLASRLESLCKQYDVTVLVSQAVVDEARHAFVFRGVDVVAVKGKSQGVRVYELLGPVGMALPPEMAVHQAALGAYLQRDFARACQLLAPQLHDGPSRVLSERCSHLSMHPPPPGWDGVWVATSK
jgi:adenylate cyclase